MNVNFLTHMLKNRDCVVIEDRDTRELVEEHESTGNEERTSELTRKFGEEAPLLGQYITSECFNFHGDVFSA